MQWLPSASHIPFESSLKFEGTCTTKVGAAVQVAFIVTGCTHATTKRYKRLLGIDAVGANTFMSTIIKIYPLVKQLVDNICDKAKGDMKIMDQTKSA